MGPGRSASPEASVFFRVVTAEFAFDVLPDPMHLAVGQFNRLGSGAIFYAILGEAGAHSDRLAHIVAEIFSLGSAPLQSGKRDGFKRPGVHAAVSFLYIQVKISVRVLPLETGEGAREIHALICVEFGGKRVMRGCGNSRGKQSKNRHHKNTGESALHDYLLDRKG